MEKRMRKINYPNVGFVFLVLAFFVLLAVMIYLVLDHIRSLREEIAKARLTTIPPTNETTVAPVNGTTVAPSQEEPLFERLLGAFSASGVAAVLSAVVVFVLLVFLYRFMGFGAYLKKLNSEEASSRLAGQEADAQRLLRNYGNDRFEVFGMNTRRDNTEDSSFANREMANI